MANRYMQSIAISFKTNFKIESFLTLKETMGFGFGGGGGGGGVGGGSDDVFST